MPFVEIFSASHSNEALKQMGEAVHAALVAAIKIPPCDRFQVFRTLSPGEYFADPSYLEIDRSSDILFIRITLRSGRSPEMKRALYRTIAENLTGGQSVRAEDIFIVLVENETIDWSFGKGVAQCAKT